MAKPPPLTPVSSMRGFWGLMRAYWFSDQWKEAWALTAAVAVITIVSNKTGVWLTKAAGELANSIAYFHLASDKSAIASVLTSAGMLVLIVVLKDLGIGGALDMCNKTLHRKWRSWLNRRYNSALLDANHTHFHVQHVGRDQDGVALPPPDNIDQRVHESIKDMTGGAIGLASGAFGALSALVIYGYELVKMSQPIAGFEFLGDYGFAVFALTAVAIYVPLNTYFALKIGKLLERLNAAMQRAEGSYRAELTTFLRRSFHVAASRGENVQADMHDHLYRDIDRTWAKQNWISTAYSGFGSIYDFVAFRIVAYAPGLLPYMSQKLSFKDYITGAEMVNQVIRQCSWFIHVMPAIASLKANARRMTDLAEAIERVQVPADFYRQTGRFDFRVVNQHPMFGLTVRQLELTHAGEDTEPFVSAPILRFRRGEWTFMKGESGCGKSSLIKAINGLWPHGSGEIAFPEGISTFYAAQDVRLSQVSLKQLVCLPEHEDGYSDAAAAAALHKAGLGEFIESMGDVYRDGKSWDDTLSGGQKQKLVLARILLHKPGLLFLDEATGALDGLAKIAFHQAIKDNCPGITVISVMHEPEPPRSAKGEQFYSSVLSIAGGVASKMPLRPDLPVEITKILTRPGRQVGSLAPRARQKHDLE